MKLFKRILGKLGFNWCDVCGTKLEVEGHYKGAATYDCPQCKYPENLERFDITPLTKDAKEHKEKVEKEKGKPPVKRKQGRPKKTQ